MPGWNGGLSGSDIDSTDGLSTWGDGTRDKEMVYMVQKMVYLVQEMVYLVEERVYLVQEMVFLVQEIAYWVLEKL